MRFYAKLLLLIVVFACLMSPPVRRGASDLAYEVRVQAVLTFGTRADIEALVEDTQRMLAVESGSLDTYLAGKRYRELLAAALADAKRRNVPLTDELSQDLEIACAREAFADLASKSHRTPSPRSAHHPGRMRSNDDTAKSGSVATGEKRKASNETLFVDLFGPSSNTLISAARGTGTILNDD
jgi:hypothetical protein